MFSATRSWSPSDHFAGPATNNAMFHVVSWLKVLGIAKNIALAWEMRLIRHVIDIFINNGPYMADFIRIALSILVPPVGVFLKVGFGGQFWLNLLLTLLFYIPGLVHAVWVISKASEKSAIA